MYLKVRNQCSLVLASLSLGLAVPAFIYPKRSNAPVRPEIGLLRTPEGGIQPQTALGSDGVLRMIYFKGDPGAGDIEYVRRPAGAEKFSEPIRVNSQPASAVAVGTVRGPQMAVGREGRVYVVWFGSEKAAPRGPGGATPVLFSRLNDSGAAFEPQRCLVQYARGVDGGLSVAASPRGRVYVVWHATGNEPGEAHRRVYLARSADDGKTFSREVGISPAALGACGCCGMRAVVDARGMLYVLYRAAAESVNRDMTLLVSRDGSATFRSLRVAPWRLNACPMSSASLNAGGNGVLAAWETAGQVYFNRLNPQSLTLSPAIAPAGPSDDRKHPAVASNQRGWVLLSWTEGTGWEKGGTLAWQVYNPSGDPVGAEGHAEGVPVWDLPSVFTDPKGNFTIVY